MAIVDKRIQLGSLQVPPGTVIIDGGVQYANPKPGPANNWSHRISNVKIECGSYVVNVASLQSVTVVFGDDYKSWIGFQISSLTGLVEPVGKVIGSRPIAHVHVNGAEVVLGPKCGKIKVTVQLDA